MHTLRGHEWSVCVSCAHEICVLHVFAQYVWTGIVCAQCVCVCACAQDWFVRYVLCVCVHALWESVCTASVCVCKRTWDWRKLVSRLPHPWVCLRSNEDLTKKLGEGPCWVTPYVLPQ